MKRLIILLSVLFIQQAVTAQNCYWVFLTDKQGTTFDPYTYFDAKAIERYQLNGADLFDISNYPLNTEYTASVGGIAQEIVGTSRWLNAIGVTATPEQASQIAQLPCVKRIQIIESEAVTASYAPQATNTTPLRLSDQLIRQQGNLFQKQGIDGEGVRIAVFDGGFPKVNTHEAFRHLRESGRILKTWNFCNKKEDVYGWSSHGTMTLSCIAGIRKDSIKLGLATGAEFLLARTEVDAEPFKEEIWWAQAMEWADQNGAQIISSSLGYGKDRHFTKDMDGTSYVAKAANMAARKGILVCNSAGNEGDDKRWKTIITPADADSVLCVGGIENSLTEYRHIAFSSYGPSADGRLKPNVCNFGFANVASPSADNDYSWVYGTSFSCPLTAGFAACAIQAHPGRTAMQMKAEIEQSADLYPYFDYAFGYGVPQASYFLEGKTQVQPTFEIRDEGVSLFIYPTRPAKAADLFLNSQYKDGAQLERYQQITLSHLDSNKYIVIHKSCLTDRILNVHYAGYTASATLSDQENQFWKDSMPNTGFSYTVIDTAGFSDWGYEANLDRTPEMNQVNEKTTGRGLYFMLGTNMALSNIETDVEFWSPSFHLGTRKAYLITKAYRLGWGLEWNNTHLNLDPSQSNDFDNSLGISSSDAKHKQLRRNSIQLEIFQSVRFLPGGMLTSNGLHWELGAYASWSRYCYAEKYTTFNELRTFVPLEMMDAYRFNYGVITRISYDFFGLYASYRLSRLSNPDQIILPRLEFGLSFNFR